MHVHVCGYVVVCNFRLLVTRNHISMIIGRTVFGEDGDDDPRMVIIGRTVFAEVDPRRIWRGWSNTSYS